MDAIFDRRLGETAMATEAVLDRLLSADPREGETARPARLIAAMRYAVLAPGKRLRPFLLIESARLFGDPGPAAVDSAAALECVHAYSLVHDDLPAMDDDDFRRGRPTVHRAFDEATAILAGDALLTLAFDALASLDAAAALRAELVRLLARAAGVGGMAGGQHLDIAAESEAPDEAGILRLQAMKTGALIRFACQAGAIVGGASPADQARLGEFGEKLGAAFQVADDLLDATATPEAAGKATAKDAARGKATVVARRGIEGARTLLERMLGEAMACLAPFGERADALRGAARFVADRRR